MAELANYRLTDYDDAAYRRMLRKVSWFLDTFLVSSIKVSGLEKLVANSSSGKSAIIVANHFSRQDFLKPIISLYHAGLRPPCIAAAEDMMKIPIFNKAMIEGRAWPLHRSSSKVSLATAKKRDEELYQMLEQMLGNGENVWQFGLKGRNYSGKDIPLEEGLLRAELKALADIEGKSECEKSNLMVNYSVFPVWLGYSRVIEDEIFSKLQKGMKGRGKATALLDAIMIAKSAAFQSKVEIYMHVGDPIELVEYKNVLPKKAASSLCTRIRREWTALYQPMPLEIFSYGCQKLISDYCAIPMQYGCRQSIAQDQLKAKIKETCEALLNSEISKIKPEYLVHARKRPDEIIKESWPHLHNSFCGIPVRNIVAKGRWDEYVVLRPDVISFYSNIIGQFLCDSSR